MEKLSNKCPCNMPDCPHGGQCDYGCEKYANWVAQIRDCLAAYEDTGLEPDEIESIKLIPATNELLAYRASGLTLDDMPRAAELFKADKEGWCVVLPCKVGDSIFSISSGEVVAMTVESIHCWNSGVWKFSAHTNKANTYWKAYEIRLDAFGKTVFLTRAEAEAILRKGAEHDGD